MSKDKEQMIDSEVYESIIEDVLDTIREMRSTGDYDENTLETLEWKLSKPEEQ
jgi:hypothetical protein